jgi:hypothetical protein
VLAALNALSGQGAESGARTLLVVFDRYGLRGEAKVLEGWLAQMGGEACRAAT